LPALTRSALQPPAAEPSNVIRSPTPTVVRVEAAPDGA
jgi:hypothetical protein